MTTILFTRGVPAPESFPLQEIGEATQEALARHGKVALQYGPSTGFLPLREWIAERESVPIEQVLVGNGSLQIFEFLCWTRFKAGDVVLTEAPTYDRVLTMLRRHHVRPVGVRLEADGPDIDALEQAMEEHRPKAFYLIPDFQNPAGATCSGEKRRRIVELAEKHDVLLIEDGPYRPLRYRGKDEPSIRSLAPKLTVQMSSFSKLLGPGARVGWVVADGALLKAVAKVAEDTYICGANLAHAIAYEWCRAGKLAPQIERLKALYAPRLDACLAALAKYLPDAKTTKPEGGFFLSVTLPEGLTTSGVREAAVAQELQLADGEAFFPDGGGERFLRLPYCALTPDEIDEGVRRLAAAVKSLRK